MFKFTSLPKLAATGAVTIALGLATLAPTPAQANDNLHRFLLGAAGVVALGAILNQQAQAQNRGHVVTRQAPPQRVHRPQQRAHRQAVLPRRCVRGHGRNRYVAAPCLRHSGYRVRALPNQCMVKVHNGPRGFLARCLRRNGYQFG